MRILQVVCDDTLLLTNIYTGWPGSTHDARVLRNSELFTRAEAGSCIDPDKLIIGDSAYPLKPWLVTPFRQTEFTTKTLQPCFTVRTTGCRALYRTS